jgi:hypothetical protein
MRILRFFSTTLVFLIVFSVISFFVAREVLLYWGYSSLKNSLASMREVRRQESYVYTCLQRGSDGDGTESVVTLQLRFDSSSEYILEAVCQGFSMSPIEISRQELPPYVLKLPGTSGFHANSDEYQGVTLTAFAAELEALGSQLRLDLSRLIKQRTIVYDGQRLEMMSGGELDLASGPITSCEGYGFNCCQLESEMGVGDQISGLSGCEKTCFSRCERRPVVLSLNTNPFTDAQTRTLSVTAGEPVEFIYVADDVGRDTIKARFDFGDGETQEVDGRNNRVSHTFTCSRSSCSYIVSLSLENEMGIPSIPTRVSELKVVVSSQ